MSSRLKSVAQKLNFIYLLSLGFLILLAGVLFLTMSSRDAWPYFVIALAVVAMIFSLFFKIVSHRLITSRLDQLMGAAKNYEAEISESEMQVEGDDEINEFGSAMNEMVHNLKERLQKLEYDKATLTEILNHMVEGMIAVDESLKIATINSRAETILQLNPGTSIGRSLIETVRSSELETMLKNAIEKDRTLELEVKLVHLGNKMIRATAVGIAAEKHEVVGLLIINDLSDVRRLESMRRDFVANVSHELKTPLTSIKGFIETLISGAFKEPKQAEFFLKMMQEDANRLSSLIEDLLELSRIESHQTALTLVPCQLKKEVDEVTEHFRFRLQEKEIELGNHIPEGDDSEIVADREYLRQIFVNLISNAIKFNKPKGKIDIEALRMKREMVISVKDTGIGIPDNMGDRIFERFFRVDKARSRELGGTGLGLSIVKHAVESHGGKVRCESELGCGTTFIITLPMANVAGK